MGQYTNADGTVVRFTDAEVFETAAALYAVIEQDYNGTPNMESKQVETILNSLETGRPLDTAEWDALTFLEQKYADALAKILAQPDWDGQNPLVKGGSGRVVPGTGPTREAMREAVAPPADPDDPSSGAMVALYPTEDVARALAQDGGERWQDIHLTLVFLGPASMIRDIPGLKAAVGKWASRTSPLAGAVSGTGTFTAGPEPVAYASADVPDLPACRQALVDALDSAGIAIASDHGFTPHLTLGYGDAASGASVDNLPLLFEHATLAIGGEQWDYPLSARPLLSTMRLSRDALDLALGYAGFDVVRESRPSPPPNLRDAAPADEAAEAAGTPTQECGSCKMFDVSMTSCWGYGNFPVRESWLCDSWTLAPGWQTQDKVADYLAQNPYASPIDLALGGLL